MNGVLLREILTALIGLVVLAGAGVLIYNGRGDENQAWLIVGLVVQYFFGRATSAAAFDQAARAYPTTTATAANGRAQVRAEPQD